MRRKKIKSGLSKDAEAARKLGLTYGTYMAHKASGYLDGISEKERSLRKKSLLKPIKPAKPMCVSMFYYRKNEIMR